MRVVSLRERIRPAMFPTTRAGALRRGRGPAALLLLGAALLVPATPAPGQVIIPGTNIIDNSGIIPFDQAFFAFEVEGPIGSLKDVPIWDEIEMMLDNPYAIELAPDVPGNAQGFPSYRSTHPRRRSFIYRNAAGEPCAPGTPGCNEVPLARHVVHPLNYNHSTGEELRLLNIEFEGADWMVPFELVLVDPGDPLGEPPIPASYEWTYAPVFVSPGEDRIEDDEAAPDFNSPIAPDTVTTIRTVDMHTSTTGPVPEGSLVTGGDPGEPGYAGFGVLLDELPAPGEPGLDEQYSTPAVPGPAAPGDSVIGYQLFDPARGFIVPRDPTTGDGGLRKPSLRVPEVGGTPAKPNYAVNSEAALAPDPAALVPSNENDYVRDRDAAIALGKALFWDMQVGSDGIQACASCHFHAGADNRTRNQLNPNHLGGDVDLEVFDNNVAFPRVNTQDNNQDVVASDFPFHKLVDNSMPGERASDGDGIVDNNAANVECHSNDVMSSMGVVFHTFVDVPVGPAAFGPAYPGTSGPPGPPGPLGPAVRPLLPDIGTADPDPIPLFQDLRRVEPRNTPTLFASAMNFDNFWDGRARHDFNGGSVFGPADPQAHVFVTIVPPPPPGRPGSSPMPVGIGLTATRQVIRFVSLASLATGPVLSNFEMSFNGRNWAKVGKKLLQPGVTPLANQLVDPDDSALGKYSGQRSTVGGPVDRPGRPGLNVSYRALIRKAFYPELWANGPGGESATGGTHHLNGAPCGDPFDGYCLTIAMGSALPLDTNQFNQMEANMSLFFGLSVHVWGTVLVPDDSPMDRFFDANPDAFATFGEANEPGIAFDLLRCDQVAPGEPCFQEVGNFKRDPDVVARIGVPFEGGGGGTLVPSGGTRMPGDPDPLFGLDLFLGSNLSLKNPLFRSARCGECHAAGNLTDATFETSHQLSFGDKIQEFVTGAPGIEFFPEALGRGRVISGFLLEGELQENAQDAVERNVADFALDAGGHPQGQAIFDNGMYNIGVTPIENDLMRGGNDPFGFPLSLSVLALKNLGGVDYSPGGDDPTTTPPFAQPPFPGIPLPNFEPDPTVINPLTGEEGGTTGGLFEPTAQDQQINPGFGEEPAVPQLPPYLAPWASNVPVGDESNIDEVFVGLNTVMAEPMLEGFVDAFGPFNPAAILGEAYNNADGPIMATWPNVNRVNRVGNVKAPPLRHVARTGPYFHNGGKLTLRQVIDFYMRGGDFPMTNAGHRDFLIANLNIEDEALGGVDPATGLPPFTEAQKEAAKDALVDFLLELTDERVDFRRAPFDQVEIFLPLDGTAPQNTVGRAGLLVDPMFQRVAENGAGGTATPIPNFLGISDSPVPGPNNDHHDP
jgi:hypothetical protein